MRFWYGIALIAVILSLLLVTIPVRADSAKADLVSSASLLSTSDNSYQYRIIVTNKGPENAEHVIISNPLPIGTTGYITHIINPNPTGCPDFKGDDFHLCIPKLTPGASVIIDYLVNSNDPNRFLLINKIQVESSSFDMNPANNFSFLIVRLNASIPEKLSLPIY